MDGSQLPTEWTLLSKQSVPGVSDSKKRDVSLTQNGTASKKGPMTENEDVKKMSKMTKMSIIPESSINVPMTEKAESTTYR